MQFRVGPAEGLRNLRRMTPQERTRALDAARAAGIDLELLESNLRLSVKERWAQHDAALDFAQKLATAKEANDARLRLAAGATR